MFTTPDFSPCWSKRSMAATLPSGTQSLHRIHPIYPHPLLQVMAHISSLFNFFWFIHSLFKNIFLYCLTMYLLIIKCSHPVSPGGAAGVSGLSRFTSSTVATDSYSALNISPGLTTNARRASRSQDTAGGFFSWSVT